VTTPTDLEAAVVDVKVLLFENVNGGNEGSETMAYEATFRLAVGVDDGPIDAFAAAMAHQMKVGPWGNDAAQSYRVMKTYRGALPASWTEAAPIPA
jgi:hypothetical protein